MSETSHDDPRWTICICGHAEHQHRATPSGRFVCCAVTHGTTSSGVIGLPYSYECECVNYRTEFTERQRKIAEEATRSKP